MVDTELQAAGIPKCCGNTTDASLRAGRRKRKPANGEPATVRAAQIEGWVAAHPEVERWVALDDMHLPLDSDNFVETDPDVGLTTDDAERAIALLLG